MISRPFLFSTLILLAATAAITAVNLRGSPEVRQINLDRLPLKIGGYEGVKDRFPQSVYDVLNADAHIYRHYVSPRGHRVDLYIGYYGTAKGGRTSHNPYGCLPGAGWAIVSSDQIEVPVAYETGDTRLNYLVSRKGPQYQCMVHWYQASGTRVLTTGWQMNIQRFVGRVLQNRNDGAYVQVSAVTGEQGLPKVKARLRAFAEEVLALLPTYWPEEA